jgi:Mrp family chromosome partitioning ATPase
MKRDISESQEVEKEKSKEEERLQSTLQRIRYKVLVLSGKGGVGKSSIAVNLAVSLAASGKKTGIFDADLHGPSVPTMFGVEGRPLQVKNEKILPVEKEGVKILSVGFLLQNQNQALIWRGPMKTGVIRQFFTDAEWGDLDYLIVDLPPGTGDEPLSICQLFHSPDGAIIVTTPQTIAAVDVRKSITFCNKLNVRVLGVIENMSGFICPHCGKESEIFHRGVGGELIAEEMGVPFLGRIPIDPLIGIKSDEGIPWITEASSTKSGRVFRKIVEPVFSLETVQTKTGSKA